MFQSIYNLIYNFLFYTQYDEAKNRRNINYSYPINLYSTISYIEQYIINSRNIKLYYQKFCPKNNN